MKRRDYRLRPLRSVLLLTAACALSLFATSTVQAASVCVDTVAKLYTALNQSAGQPDNAPYTIKVVKGIYNFGTYQASASSQFNLLGGYADATCTTRSVDPDNTVFDFNGNGYLAVYQGVADPIATITVEGITFRHGQGVNFSVGKFNDFPALSNDPGNIVVRNTRFTDLTSSAAGPYVLAGIPVSLFSRDGSVSITNTVFDHLTQPLQQDCEVSIDLIDDATASLFFVTADTSGGKSFCIEPDSEGNQNIVQIFNSIIWPNDGVYGTFQPLHFIEAGNDEVPPDVSLYYNTLFGYDGGATVQDFATQSANPQDKPQWINPVAGAAGQYGLLPTSTSINSGFPAGLIPYPSIDIASNPRVVGVPDRGAFESPYAVTPSTVVTNTNNGGPGSLRAAISIANQFSNVDTISFNLPGCPSVIALTSALPPISQPVIIDGYAGNPLASQNGDANAFNAKLCVVIQEASPGTIANALNVSATGGVTVRGLAFGDFVQQIAIFGGTNHVIAGNQFGGKVGNINLYGGSQNNILVHGVTSGSINIGGPTPGERNVIAYASKNGIYMDNSVTTGNCHINNNLIGLGPNGTSQLGNENGILLQNSNCEISKNRIAGNLLDGVVIQGGQGNKVQSNSFGIDAQGNSTYSYGWAVRVEANNNTIGATQTVGYLPALGNAISFQGAGGVYVNGYSNSVRSNLSGFNGDAHDGSAPDIKLGPNGNFQQKFALIDSLTQLNGLPLNVSKTATLNGHLASGNNANYRIDVYYSETCAPSGRGHAEYYLSSKQVTTNANGSVSFSIPVTLPVSPATSVLSLTATDDYANSSEIGNCYSVDTIFKAGF
ncbi:MAG: right-handed parallel beta-helix repeat-containing protein [Tahibacter sp.]